MISIPLINYITNPQCNRSTRSRKIVSYPGLRLPYVQVTWTGLRKLKKLGLVQLSGTKFRKVPLWLTSHGIMEAFLKKSTKNHIITIDGMYAPKANPEHPRISIACRDICERENTCKLVIASSMEVIEERISDIQIDYSLYEVRWMISIGLLRIPDFFFLKPLRKNRCFVRYGVARQDKFRC